MTDLCRRLTSSNRFEAVMLAVILLNAVVLGLETFEDVERDIAQDGVVQVGPPDLVCRRASVDQVPDCLQAPPNGEGAAG